MSEPDHGIEHIDANDAPDHVKRLAEHAGGTLTEVGRLPDGSGFALMSMPLPKDHWSVVNPDAPNVPPAPFKMGVEDDVMVRVLGRAGTASAIMTRQQFADALHNAGKYAYRCATMNGKEPDLDPDALLQNLVVGLLGYWTIDGESTL